MFVPLAAIAHELSEPDVAIDRRGFAAMGGSLQAVIARYDCQPPRRGIGGDQLLDQRVGIGVARGEPHAQALVLERAGRSPWRLRGVEHHNRPRHLLGRNRLGQQIEHRLAGAL